MPNKLSWVGAGLNENKANSAKLILSLAITKKSIRCINNKNNNTWASLWNYSIFTTNSITLSLILQNIIIMVH